MLGLIFVLLLAMVLIGVLESRHSRPSDSPEFPAGRFRCLRGGRRRVQA